MLLANNELSTVLAKVSLLEVDKLWSGLTLLFYLDLEDNFLEKTSLKLKLVILTNYK